MQYLDECLVNNSGDVKILIARNLGQVGLCLIEEIRHSQLLQSVVELETLFELELGKVNLHG